jgi:hypothetical protein
VAASKPYAMLSLRIRFIILHKTVPDRAVEQDGFLSDRGHLRTKCPEMQGASVSTVHFLWQFDP